MSAASIGLTGGLMLALVSAMVARAQETRLDKIVGAALHGPEMKKVKYLRHEFNVKKAKVSDHVAGMTKIEGQISHHVLFRPDEQFFYAIEKCHGKITKVDFKIERDSLAPHAGKLAQKLPTVPVSQQEIEATLRKLTQKLDDGWEMEAEAIAIAIALRADPFTHNDLVVMLKQGKQVDLLGREVASRGSIAAAAGGRLGENLAVSSGRKK